MPDPQPGSTIGIVLGWIGLALLLLVGFPYLVSGLIVPVPNLFGIWLVWAAFALSAPWLFRRRAGWFPSCRGSRSGVYDCWASERASCTGRADRWTTAAHHDRRPSDAGSW